MSRTQRLGFLAVAVAIAVAAVVVLAAGSGSDEQEAPAPVGTATPAGTTTPDGTATVESPTPEAKPKPKVPVLQAGSVKKLRFAEGDTIRFHARHDAPEEVHVHGYDLMHEVGPGRPAEFSFKATITGIFEVELEGAGEHIGELRVDPR